MTDLFPRLCLLILCGISLNSCVREDEFPKLNSGFAWPIDIAASDDGTRFYVLNSDADRTYDTGSITVLDSEGNKIGAVETARLGRSIEVAGDVMLVTFGGEAGELNGLNLFDLSDPDLPVLAKRFDLSSTCIPVNTAMRAGYGYFAMTCMSDEELNQTGSLHIGKLAANLADSELIHVRETDRIRRALHIDPLRGLLFAFPSDLKRELSVDQILADESSYDADSDTIVLKQPNEVPDTLESSARLRERAADRHLYQVLVYDIERESSVGFPLRKQVDHVTSMEYRWIYYTGHNIDGLPDPNDNSFTDPNFKHYRTNFWSTYPDADDPNIFYVSHRNRPVSGSLYANDILKVTIHGDAKQRKAKKATDLAPTLDYLSFERIYGFNQEAQDWHYPGDFEVRRIRGFKSLLVNHFRDLTKWNRSDVRFGIVAKSLEAGQWFREVTDTSAFSSYFQLAANDDGVVMSCSFYGNSVMRLAVTPGADTIEVKRIE